MGLLDMCCPKKPKKSLDYVIKWVEATDKTIKNLSDTVQELNKWKEDISKETLSPIFNEYAKTYPWDNVPAFNTKADKVENVIVGHLASLDENGNLQDSGKKPADFVPNVSGATEGNLPQFDANGNIQDSGNKAEDFALVGHSHSVILDKSTESSVSIEEGRISIFIQGEGSGGETEINANNIGNLHRALVTPSSMPENDATKLITSKAVYDALAGKANSAHHHNIYNLLDVSTLIDTIISLSDRVRELEGSHVSQMVTCSASYQGYVQYFCNGNSIIYNPSNDRDIIYNLPSELYNLAQVGSKVIVRSNGTEILNTRIIKKQTGFPSLELKDAIPNDSSVSGTTIQIEIIE